MFDDAQIVGNKQIGQVHLLLQLLKKIDDLRLDRNVSDDTGSSQTMNLGLTASARAMPIRWRCPPLNSCGYRS